MLSQNEAKSVSDIQKTLCTCGRTKYRHFMSLRELRRMQNSGNEILERPVVYRCKVCDKKKINNRIVANAVKKTCRRCSAVFMAENKFFYFCDDCKNREAWKDGILY